ncbi:hypothetical protein BC938DRAFT_478640, partial [Jimgerdemannia flammicorona]
MNLLRRRSSFPSLVLRTPLGLPGPAVFGEGFTRSGMPTPDTLSVFRENLPADCFFSAVMLVKWSNVLGPKVEKVWSPENSRPDETTMENAAKQILNGEIGRNVVGIEPKFLVLGDEGIIATSFLFTEYAVPPTFLTTTPASSNSTFPSYFPSTSPPIPSFMPDDTRRRNNAAETLVPASLLDPTRLSALAFVVPTRFMAGFMGYFEILVDRVPGLVEKLRRLKRGSGMV